MKFIFKEELKIILKIQDFFLSILSKQVEHNKCPFLTQKVLVDLSISFLQIKHLNIGDINKNSIFLNFINFSYMKSEIDVFKKFLINL